jgi:hypothetical protein
MNLPAPIWIWGPFLTDRDSIQTFVAHLEYRSVP